MGEVYRARDSKLDRDVAIKVLPESVAADPEALARFEREAKAVAALSHPNILAIFDFGTQDGVAYAVMELLEGETLRGKLDAGARSRRSRPWTTRSRSPRGLSAAHEKGRRPPGPEAREPVRHRKTATSRSSTSAWRRGSRRSLRARRRARRRARATRSPGPVMGTVGYMSPEQVRGLPVDHRSDIFSFGAILYELLSGKKAFKRDTASDTMAAILKDEPPELSESGRNISPALDHIVRHCLEKDRDNRFQSAQGHRVRALGAVLASRHERRTAGGATGRERKERLSSPLRSSSFSPSRASSSCGGRTRAGARPGASSAWPCCRSRTWALPRTTTSPTASRTRCAASSRPCRAFEVIARGSSTPYKKTTKTPEADRRRSWTRATC